jgi:hypothetical protein
LQWCAYFEIFTNQQKNIAWSYYFYTLNQVIYILKEIITFFWIRLSKTSEINININININRYDMKFYDLTQISDSIWMHEWAICNVRNVCFLSLFYLMHFGCISSDDKLRKWRIIAYSLSLNTQLKFIWFSFA